MIARIPRRLGFSPFRGTRAHRVGALAIRASFDPPVNAVHVAYSTPKRIGSAVVRNRVRRRLRELMRARSAQVPAGWYLISVEREIVDNDWGQLGTLLDAALERVLHARSTGAITSSHTPRGVV